MQLINMQTKIVLWEGVFNINLLVLMSIETELNIVSRRTNLT